MVVFDSVKTNYPNVSNAIRNCADGIFTLRSQNPVTTNTYVHYEIGGTAVNGVDYTLIADSALFNTGDSITQITIHPLGVTNAPDSATVILYLFNQCSSVAYDSSVMFIIDSAQVFVSADTNICPGDSVQLSATGGASYSWSPATGLSNNSIANPIAKPPVTTTYICNSSVGSCQSSASLTITVGNTHFSVNTPSNLANCSGQGGVQLNATVTGNPVTGNPFVYYWTPDIALSNDSIINPVATPAVTTMYTINVVSGNCTADDSVLVSIGSLHDTVSVTNAFCYGIANGSASISLGGMPPYTFKWSNGANTQTATGLAAGTYYVTATDNAGCVVTDSAVVAQPVQGVVAIYPPDTTIALGNSIQLSSSFSLYSDSDIIHYNWSPPAGLSCVDCPNPVVNSYNRINQYTLTVGYDNDSCYASAQVQILVTGSQSVYIPNVFAPNGNGENDVFMVYGKQIKTVDLKIFNRWGEKVFDSNNQYVGWDGTYKGVLQNPGVYVYEANITFLDNTQSLRTGSVTLLR